MTAKRDYYEVLGVSRSTTPDELKKSYRRLAMKYHPDKNRDDEDTTDKFKEITEAYQILSDPDKRARYDRFGHAAPEDFGMGAAGVDISSMTDFFESIFGSVFGGGAPRRRRRRGRPGRDLQYDLELELEDAVSGAEVKINVPRPVRCETCDGSGAAPGSGPTRCPQCDGVGSVRLQQGIFAVSTTCPVCHGSGETIHDKCPECAGQGLTVQEEEFNVSIPAGIEDGAVKIIPGGGEHGRGGAPDGDLHVMVRVKRHETFLRRGQDLHCVVTVNYPQAVLGAEIEVPTIKGSAVMKVKPGTENGQTYRLKAKGVPSLRGNFVGDQLVHIEVDVPKKLTDRQRELIEELGRELGGSTSPQAKSHSFIERLKGFFD